MSVEIPFGARGIVVGPRWRLALAIAPADSFGGPAPSAGLHVGVEQPPLPGAPRRGLSAAVPVDHAVPRNRSGTFTLVHRADRVPRATPGESPVREVVIRMADPMRRWVPRRLLLPVWTSRGLVDQAAGPSAADRSIVPHMFPGAGYAAPGGSSGLRGRILRFGEPLRWARVTAFGPREVVLGRAHGDERGEFLLLIATTGNEPMPPPSRLIVRLEVRAPASFPPRRPDRDPIGDLVVEDAVLRAPGSLPGQADPVVLCGERDPAGYLLSPERPTVELTVGAIVQPPPLSVT